MSKPSTPHLEAALQHDIEQICGNIRCMAELDVQALKRAFTALQKRNRELAYAVILREQDVDTAETELDRLCLEFILRHQPAASVLRFVYSASKVATQLERVGDYAENIARQVLQLTSIPAIQMPDEQFKQMANLAIPMLGDAVRAFVERDADLARRTLLLEPRINELRDSITAELLEWRRQGRLPLEALTPLITVARRFERVSDQATNICEQALYFATGENLRHPVHAEGFRILFVDENNGALSRMAEAAGNRLAAPRFSFSSAGITAGDVDAQTALYLSKKGINPGQPGRKVSEALKQQYVQVIIVLCEEADRALPQKPTKTLGLRWHMADPSTATGSPEEIGSAYNNAFEYLDTHIRELVNAIVGQENKGANNRVSM